MKYVLLHEFETRFKRTPFKAAEDIATMSADEQRWFVWQYRRKTEECDLASVEEWTPKEFGEAVADFFGVTTPSTP
jgi:hypothetical protein